jgi:hypothetical protein
MEPEAGALWAAPILPTTKVAYEIAALRDFDLAYFRCGSTPEVTV